MTTADEPDLFAALASPVRRAILERLRSGPQPVNALAGGFDLGRPAVSEHLQVLRRARLVREERRGRERHYHLDAGPMAEVERWIATFNQYWHGRLAALELVLDEEEPP
jgi:DNA-binding transcriptional ArsR family regulator